MGLPSLRLAIIAGLVVAGLTAAAWFWSSAKEAGRDEVRLDQALDNVETLERMRDAEAEFRAIGPASNRLRDGAF